MNRHIETLLSEADQFLARLKQSGGDNFPPADELRRVALQLVQINTNSLSRTSREKLRSTLIALTPFILRPEEIRTIEESELQRASLTQELARASTRRTRREPTKNLRILEEQQILFLRGRLNDSQKKHAKSKRERKTYFRAMRTLGIGTQEKTCDAELLTDKWRRAIERGTDTQENTCDDTEK